MRIPVVAGIIAALTASTCFGISAALQAEPKVMPYYGEEWSFDIEEKDYPYITIVPEDRPRARVYGNGSVEKIEPKQRKYEIVLLAK